SFRPGRSLVDRRVAVAAPFGDVVLRTTEGRVRDRLPHDLVCAVGLAVALRGQVARDVAVSNGRSVLAVRKARTVRTVGSCHDVDGGRLRWCPLLDELDYVRVQRDQLRACLLASPRDQLSCVLVLEAGDHEPLEMCFPCR